jgi:triosephosphate isomerase
MKKLIFAANWKMNLGPRQAKAYFESFLELIDKLNLSKADTATLCSNIIFFPPLVDWVEVTEKLEKTSLRWGAQNFFHMDAGAYTGENSPAFLSEIGCQLVLIGHSERRSIFHETDSEVALKIKAAHKWNLLPMMCIGETLKEREANDTNKVLEKQLEQGLHEVDPLQPLIIAYEPVWAIGTGRNATSQQANEAHEFIRDFIVRKWGSAAALKVPILYGGSVKPENSVELAREPFVDGFLSGGASLKPESFIDLISRVIQAIPIEH